MIYIDSGVGGLRLAVHMQAARATQAGTSQAVALYVHGATFPAQLSIFHRFDGYSWADQLSAKGYQVYGFDQLGFGASDRYPEMHADAFASSPLGRADEVAGQIERVVAHIQAQTGIASIHLIAHSWGTMPAALFTQRHPERVERLALFAPIARREPIARDEGKSTADETAQPAWHLVSAADQESRFNGYLPVGEKPVLDPRQFTRWAADYLASDRGSADRSPPAVKVPYAPVADFTDAVNGRLPYDPAGIRVPTLIVRGEWDHAPNDADAKWLFDALTQAPIKRDIKISRGTHVMHLEESRYALYAEVSNFFGGNDVAPL